MISLSGITRVFDVGGHEVRALENVDLEIQTGEYVSIMGPSGSGKSTLLNILGCLDRPSSGTYRLDGQETSRLDETALSRIRGHKIGFVFQFFHLIPRLTAFENIDLPMLFAGMEPAERKQKIEVALGRVGLQDRAQHRPDQLSGGERQRVAVARAIVMEPRIILADEPTGNLDSRSGTEIVELIEDLNARGITLILVTHDPKVGQRSRRCIRLEDGHVVSDESNHAGARATVREPGASGSEPPGPGTTNR